MVNSDNFAYKNPLWKRLEKEVLPFVSKSGRYVGNELNTIVKDHIGRLKVALVFPDMYEIGMSYLGLQILYHLINKRDDCLAERVFQVWPDMEKRLRQLDIPIFSLETSTPLAKFDVIGFSVTYEMHAPGILNILNLAGIPFKSTERDDRYPLIIAGGPAVLNPEPLAEFFDAIFIGDAEEAMDEIIDSLIKGNGASKEEKLHNLARIEGMYIPSFYKDDYESDRFKSITPARTDIPEKVKIRSCLNLKSEYYPAKPLLPFVGITHDRLSVEIMRGCVSGCRFCQAGYQYRPRRCRKPDEIYELIQDGFKTTGYEDITLQSLSSTDYPDLENVIERIMPFFQQNRLSLSLPSLRPGSLSQRVLEHLKSQRKTGITFAPEAGTQRLRDVMGKNITAEEIIEGVKSVFQNGWTLVKLYFMVGLPTETDDDIQGIIETVKQVSHLARTMGGKKNINVTISPFCPKPGTPWQWEEQIGIERVSEIYKKLSLGLKARNVSLKFHDVHLSVIEGILGRGDRRMASVIVKAYNNGARLDGWSEHFSFDAWENAFAGSGYNIDDLLKARPTHDILPWEHIQKGIPKRFLLDERERSFRGEPPLGVKKVEGKNSANVIVGFGRSPRKRTTVTVTPARTRIRIKYSRDERLRFYSHLDIMRAFYRAIRRAGLPVSFSQGFHPHMKLSFGPPLAVGYISKAEYLDIQFDSPLEKKYLVNLNENLPPGLQITASKIIYSKTESLAKMINCVSFRVEINNTDEDLQHRIDSLLKNKKIIVTRIKNKETIELSVGQFLYDLVYKDDVFEMFLGFTPGGYIRPSEVLIFGLGFSPMQALPLIYERTGQFLCQGVHRVEPLDLV